MSRRDRRELVVTQDWSGPRPPVTVVILAVNEELTIADCLSSCSWCDDVHVVDSGSTDRTVEIAESMGATVHYNPFESFGQQRNWAIENIDAKNDWVFHLDADERFTPGLVDEMQAVLAQDPEESAFHVAQKMMFMGQWLKRSSSYPTYQMRFFHRSRARFRDFGHGQREETDGIVGRLKQPYLHYPYCKGIYDWVDKHNRYSSLEALQQLDAGSRKLSLSDLLSADPIQRRRNWKEFSFHLPLRPQIRWLMIVVLQGGILDGRAGLTYARLMSIYEHMITLKYKMLKRRLEVTPVEFESGRTHVKDGAVDTTQVAAPQPVNGQAKPQPEPAPEALSRSEAAISREARVALSHEAKRDTPQAMPTDDEGQLLPEGSPWTLWENIVRTIWWLAGKPLFRFSPSGWYGFRRALLRMFGAKIGKGVRIDNSAHIEIPWNLDLKTDVTVGPRAILYSLGKITIGERTIVSQYAHLCAGTHDYQDRRFPLICDPIAIGPDAWIAADAYVGPNVTVGRLSVLGARSSAYKDLEPQTVYIGNPARPAHKRELA